VANAKPHDLIFYAQPLEMMEGNASSPKIFLNAPAVLERQFFAYCMDNWIKKGVPETAVPKNVGVCLNALEARSNDKFPFNLLVFIQNNI
jgi:DEAD/DEAH box helicase domain-containing protein